MWKHQESITENFVCGQIAEQNTIYNETIVDYLSLYKHYSKASLANSQGNIHTHTAH